MVNEAKNILFSLLKFIPECINFQRRVKGIKSSLRSEVEVVVKDCSDLLKALSDKEIELPIQQYENTIEEFRRISSLDTIFKSHASEIRLLPNGLSRKIIKFYYAMTELPGLVTPLIKAIEVEKALGVHHSSESRADIMEPIRRGLETFVFQGCEILKEL